MWCPLQLCAWQETGIFIMIIIIIAIISSNSSSNSSSSSSSSCSSSSSSSSSNVVSHPALRVARDYVQILLGKHIKTQSCWANTILLANNLAGYI